MRLEIQIVGRNDTETDSLVLDDGGDVVLTVDMTVVAVGNVVFMEYVHEGLTDILRKHGREVKERREGQRLGKCGIQFFRFLQTHFKPYAFAVYYLIVVCVYLSALRGFFVGKPTSGAADYAVLYYIRVVIQYTDADHPVFLHEFVHFGGGAPPIVVVSVAYELFARERLYQLQVFLCFVEVDAPGYVSRDDYRIVFGDRI